MTPVKCASLGCSFSLPCLNSFCLSSRLILASSDNIGGGFGRPRLPGKSHRLSIAACALWGDSSPCLGVTHNITCGCRTQEWCLVRLHAVNQLVHAFSFNFLSVTLKATVWLITSAVHDCSLSFFEFLSWFPSLRCRSCSTLSLRRDMSPSATNQKKAFIRYSQAYLFNLFCFVITQYVKTTGSLICIKKYGNIHQC